MGIKKINVGLIGAGFMAKAHSIAYAGMPMFFWPAPAIPVKKMIVDINEAAARDAKEKLAFESYSTDWHDIIDNPDIQVVDICTPNNAHAEIAIAAANAGKHIICEKPLAPHSRAGKGNVPRRREKPRQDHGCFQLQENSGHPARKKIH